MRPHLQHRLHTVALGMQTLEARILAFLQQGRRVLVAGDFNIQPRPPDTCRVSNSPSAFWLRSNAFVR